MPLKPHPASQRAFTLVEMLMVAAILSILLSLLLPGISHTREKVRRTACLNNLRQMIHGCLLYADDFQGHYSSAIHDTNDVLTFLYPDYVPALKTFICPSTQNRIRPDVLVNNPFSGKPELYDLTGYAGDITNSGTSYEIFGFMNYTPDTPNYTDLRILNSTVRVKGVKKTQSTVSAYPHFYNAFGLKGTVAGPSRIWLVVDGDEPPGRQNYPDPNNNHGDAGGNASFCDGHVEWVPRKQYLAAYEMSQDENRAD